jgi:alkanesulfonate monooxygenase SsuD/methylene tetrahydromethanopterin reductase-like flavin-dependent oxidoreductase (luciferase family)/predicted kinase
MPTASSTSSSAPDRAPAPPVTSLPDPALVVLVGAAGSGKSTWAAAHYRPAEVVSSDALREVVGSGPADLDASVDAFDMLDRVVAARARRRLTVVVDTLGLEAVRRAAYLAVARDRGLAAVAVVLETPAAVCRSRNARRDRPVPAAVLTAQLRRMRSVRAELDLEGWDAVHAVDGRVPEAAAIAPAVLAPADRGRVAVAGAYLQVGAFPWGQDPSAWLRSIVVRAAEVGFTGLALMDHLQQIPQVGRAWDPIPEPWVTLGHLAALDLDLRLGTLVSPVTFRPAGVLAKTVATLDVLSSGRAFVGVGAGWYPREHAGFGLALPPPAQRLDAVEDAITMMRALWSPGTKPYAAQRVSLPETTCYPRPVGAVPIVVGGSGPRSLRIAGAMGDAANVPSDEGRLDARIAAVRAAAERAGRDADAVAVTVLDVAVVGTSRDDTATRVERLRGRTAAATYAARHHAGDAAAHTERYARLRERGVRAVFLALPDLVGPDDLDRCAPLVDVWR